jgi:hypothetical protein
VKFDNIQKQISKTETTLSEQIKIFAHKTQSIWRQKMKFQTEKKIVKTIILNVNREENNRNKSKVMLRIFT